MTGSHEAGRVGEKCGGQAEYTYFYEAAEPGGNTSRGRIRAKSLHEAIRKLEKKSLKIVSLRKSELGEGSLRKRIDRSELMFFFKELQCMQASGIPIGRALGVLEGQARDPSLKLVFAVIKRTVEEGRSLAHSLGCFPTLFSPVHVQIIKAGERSGSLEQSFSYLARIMEKELTLEKKVISSLIYPLVILIAGLTGSFIVFTWAFPYIRLLINDLGVSLPFYAMLVIGMFDNLKNIWIFIPVLLLIVLAVIRLRAFCRESLDARILQERILFSTPGLRDLLRKVVIARSLIVMESLLDAGIHIPEALEYAAAASSSLQTDYALRHVAGLVRSGETLEKGMGQFPSLFPRALLGMISVGEQTGEVALMLGKTARYYEIELDSAFESFARLIEPIVITIIGAIMSVFVLSFILPIYLALNKI